VKRQLPIATVGIVCRGRLAAIAAAWALPPLRPYFPAELSRLLIFIIGLDPSAGSSGVAGGHAPVVPSVGASHGHIVDIRKAFVRAVIAEGLGSQAGRSSHVAGHCHYPLGAGRRGPADVNRDQRPKTMAMVERYAHQSGTHIAEAMERLNDRYRPKSRSS
jgi:hypothetical protein